MWGHSARLLGAERLLDLSLPVALGPFCRHQCMGISGILQGIPTSTQNKLVHPPPDTAQLSL